jgi:hypothetical protein
VVARVLLTQLVDASIMVHLGEENIDGSTSVITSGVEDPSNTKKTATGVLNEENFSPNREVT